MPPAVAMAIPAVAGAGAQAAGGKKNSNAANKAANQQFQLQQQLLQSGLSAFNPAKDYFSALLSGDPTKMAEAVGPSRDALQQQSQGAARQLAATMPSGGEANAAQAANAQNTYNSIARLTAGVQPGAAQALGQLAGLPMQLGAPNVGSGLKYDTHQQEQLGQSKGALGTGLGQMIGGQMNGKQSGGGKNSPVSVSSGGPSVINPPTTVPLPAPFPMGSANPLTGTAARA